MAPTYTPPSARFNADFFYDWGFGYYRDTGHVHGRLKIRKNNGDIYEQSFSAVNP